MSKEYLAALERYHRLGVLVENDKDLILKDDEEYKILKQALLELKSIKEANPSEALEIINIFLKCFGENDFLEVEIAKEDINTIKQALLKAQEQEKVLSIIFEKNVLIYNLKIADNLTEYNRWVDDEDVLTQKEFELLKRWSNGK